MWWTVTYTSSSFFSLKVATATSTGGKTLLIPTPYAVKMALLEAAIRAYGVEQGRSWFTAIRDARIAVQPPDRVVVNHTFQKFLRPRRGKPTRDQDTGLAPAYHHTIGYREYVQWVGSLGLAVSPPDDAPDVPWPALLTRINSLGKRGGFVQMQAAPSRQTALSSGWVNLSRSLGDTFPLGILQLVDDCTPTLSFEKANVYTDKRITFGRDRILREVVIPYTPAQSSRSFTLYKRTD